jgi:glycosyltransferase involved in cell wall biosynthesis
MNYMPGFTYQENQLTAAMANDGHEVIVIAPKGLHKIYKKVDIEGDVMYRHDSMDRLVRVIRLPSRRLGSRFYILPGLSGLLKELKPEILFVHGPQQLQLISAVIYARKRPDMRFVIDNHADLNNTASNWISRNVLHRCFWRAILRFAYSRIDRILYISEETKLFLKTLYGIPDDKLEFYPLGGTIPAPEDRAEARERIRLELGLSAEDILICHSGKLDSLKRTEELLKAFSNVDSSSLKLVIIGSIPDDMKPVLNPLIEADKRVKFLGWKRGDELLEYLCACDLYAQPGSQSATMQNALCCGAPVMLYPHLSHNVYMQGNGYFVNSVEDMVRVFNEIVDNPQKLTDMSKKSLSLAHDKLDYRRLAARLYNTNTT